MPRFVTPKNYRRTILFLTKIHCAYIEPKGFLIRFFDNFCILRKNKIYAVRYNISVTGGLLYADKSNGPVCVACQAGFDWKR